ncbi:Hypothetical protein PHPALM_9616 [Phytophthora palmivora]|uniref:Ankyrin repeat-containing domain n=1 Tax=Phytophthora palmivora TaxID=4796 RepID=A0A2P4Y6U7_9STRA|nr:Hypothetical protein PHPALM_9616 [Phytophthora palmivora]
MDSAAENGHLVVVKWLHENRNEDCTTSTLNYAARNGRLQVVLWLQHHRTEDFHREHFEMLLFLRAQYNEGCTTANIFAQEQQQRHILKRVEDHLSIP